MAGVGQRSMTSQYISGWRKTMKRSLCWLIPVTVTLVLLAACVAPPTPVVTTSPGHTDERVVTGYPDRLGRSRPLLRFRGDWAAFEAETGHKVVFNFGSTGQLAQQIEQGAPVDLFAAANVSFIDDLAQQGLIAARHSAVVRPWPDHAVDTRRQPVADYAGGAILHGPRSPASPSPTPITRLTASPRARPCRQPVCGRRCSLSWCLARM